MWIIHRNINISTDLAVKGGVDYTQGKVGYLHFIIQVDNCILVIFTALLYNETDFNEST